jgi:hypothetical protein
MPSDEQIVQALNDLQLWVKDFTDEKGWALDRTAKSRDFVTYVLGRAFPSDSSKEQ